MQDRFWPNVTARWRLPLDPQLAEIRQQPAGAGQAYLQASRSLAAALVPPSLLPEENLQPVRHFSHCKFEHPARVYGTRNYLQA